MKQILFIRHAKSSWNKIQLKDFDRPLSKRGKQDAELMGIKLLNKKIFPEIFYCSSAKRTVDTCDIILDKLGIDKNVIYEDSLYTDTYDTIKELIYSTSDKISFISIIAHNPHIQNIYNSLCENSVPPGRRIFKFPTCGTMLCYNNSTEWKHCNLISSNIIYFDNPQSQSKSYYIKV